LRPAAAAWTPVGAAACLVAPPTRRATRLARDGSTRAAPQRSGASSAMGEWGGGGQGGPDLSIGDGWREKVRSVASLAAMRARKRV
jgi:hypothetical protein